MFNRKIRGANFLKYFGPEDHFQYRTATWLKVQYPKLTWWHTPNEGKRTHFDRFKAECFGIRSGVSDIIIICPIPEHKGLCIELKSTTKPTENQLRFLHDMQSCGFDILVSYDDADLQKQIRYYVEEKYKYHEHFKSVRKLTTK